MILGFKIMSIACFILVMASVIVAIVCGMEIVYYTLRKRVGDVGYSAQLVDASCDPADCSIRSGYGDVDFE